MWWRRCTSPVTGSTASGGLLRKSCARCMPRLDADFLFCWTAIFVHSSRVFSAASLFERGKPRERGRGVLLGLGGTRCLRGRPRTLRIGVLRRIRQRKQQLVFDQ